MQLFLVLTIWGQVGITAGPLPYDMTTCLEMARQREQAVDQSFSSRAVFVENGRLVWRKDIAVGCGMFEERPASKAVLDPDALTYPSEP